MTSTDAAPAPHGLRAHLQHLLPPLHALFTVSITINQLASVPMVGGEFGVRWKWKNTGKLKGKDKARFQEREEHPHDQDHDHDADGDSFGSADTSAEDPHAHSSNGHHSSSSVLPTDDHTSSAARGQTPWLPLREHSVTWDQQLTHVVQMSIDRDTHRLLPHPFKATVVQRIVAGDPDAPHNPRLGSVELDLAEYADSCPLAPGSQPKGLVTRRYLLRNSKTNATLRLSIRVEPVNTNVLYTAPALPNGEILAGVATLLTTHDDVYRTRPRALDLYAPVEPHVSSSKSAFKSKHSSAEQSFDLRALPRAYGPRNTESLIDALFNPVSVRDEHLVGPFTKLVTADSPLPSSVSFMTTTSSSSTSSRSIARTNTVASNTSTSLAPSNGRAATNGHRHSPSLTASIAPSISPSVSSSTHASGGSATPTHHWWQRNKDRPPSRNTNRTGAVAA